MTAKVQPLFPDLTAAPGRQRYPDDFQDLWKVISREMQRNGKRVVGKKQTFVEVQNLRKLGYDNPTLAKCVLAYGKHCRDADRFPCDPQRFFRANRRDGLTFEDFLPDSDETPEAPELVAKSELAGDIAAEWQSVLERLHRSDPAICCTWFEPLTLVAVDRDGSAVLQAPGAFHARHVRDHWQQIIERAWPRGVVVQ